MTRCVALLRAVNVGGRQIAMADLRTLLAEAGCAGARTLLQSGNAVFDTKAKAAALENALEAQAQRRFGFAVAIMLRTAAEWAKLIAANPFADEAKRAPARMVYMALKAAPAADAVQALRDSHRGPEAIAVGGRDAWLVYPDGQGRSKLTNALIERKLGVAGTARNWNTVLKIAALLDA